MNEWLRAPGPAPRAAFANLRRFINDRLGFLKELHDRYGDVCRLRMGFTEIYLVSDPGLVREILLDNAIYLKSSGSKLMSVILGRGVVLAEGESHRQQRKRILPAFHRSRIATYADTIVAYAQATGERWRCGQTVDIYSEMMQLSLEIVCKCLFNAEIGGLTAGVQRAMADILPFVERIVEVTGVLKMFLPTPTNLRFWRARRYLNRLIYNVIRERRESRSDTGDLLSMLLAAQEQQGGETMTDQQVRDEVMTLFVAGHETSATALAWTWYVLATRPDIAARVYEEVDTLLDGRRPTIEDVARFRYTRMVILETMRLYSPVYLYDRSPSCDVVLGGYRIKKGAILFLSPYVMHRHPRYYADPDQFDPERWRPEAAEKRPKHAYFPFGGGPRTCVGEQFAWTEMVLIVATLLQRWRVELAPDQRIVVEPLITMRPKYGIQIVTRARAPRSQELSAKA